MKLFSGEGLHIAKQLRKALGGDVKGNYRAEPFSSEISYRIAVETWEHYGQHELVKQANEFAKRKGWFK